MFNFFKKRPTSGEALKGWLDAIKNRDEEQFAKFCQKTWLGRNAVSISQWSRLDIIDYVILSSREISRVMHSYKVSIRGRKGVSKVQLIVIKERRPYRASRLFGRWGVNPTSWRLLK